MRCRPRKCTSTLAAALVAWCVCPPVASMEGGAIEETAVVKRPALDSATLHRGYDANDPARIDRLRMAADAGRDNDALQALVALAQAGSMLAQRAAGEALLRRGDATSADEGLRWLQRAAGQGDALAALSLGRAALSGSAIAARNDARARDWFRKAYAAGATRAQAAYYLGLLARPDDAVEAVAYYREAAEQGIAEAMYQLGNACAAGDGTDQDSREAMRWYLRAAALDHPAAIQELAFAFQRGDTLLPQSDLQAANMRLAMEHALRHPKAAP